MELMINEAKDRHFLEEIKNGAKSIKEIIDFDGKKTIKKTKDLKTRKKEKRNEEKTKEKRKSKSFNNKMKIGTSRDPSRRKSLKTPIYYGDKQMESTIKLQNTVSYFVPGFNEVLPYENLEQNRKSKTNKLLKSKGLNKTHGGLLDLFLETGTDIPNIEKEIKSIKIEKNEAEKKEIQEQRKVKLMTLDIDCIPKSNEEKDGSDIVRYAE